MTQKWIIPNIPNTGKKTFFCLANCMHMLFHYQGDKTPIRRFTPLTGLPFGFRYFNNGRFVQPVVMGCTCTAALAFASEQLGYAWDMVIDRDWDAAWERIQEALTKNLPVAVGPIPYAVLSYNPKAGEELRGDHFCVLCGFDKEKDTVWVNDPDGFSYEPLSLSTLQSVWQNSYPQCPISPHIPLALIVTVKVQLYQGGESLKATLGRACRVMRGEIIYDPLEVATPPQFTFTGIPGAEKLAADIRNRFDGTNRQRLSQIARRMQEVTFLQGTQAKADIAYFLRDWAKRLGEKETREQLTSITECYETESSLYLEAVKTCSLITRAIAANTGIDEPWNRLAQIVEEIASIETDALARFEELSEMTP